MNRKYRWSAIAMAACVAVSVAAVNPFAQAAEQETPEQLLGKCGDANWIAGEHKNFGSTVETCDFIEETFTVTDGEEVKASIDFANCPPDTYSNGQAQVAYSHTVGQSVGSLNMDSEENSVLIGALSGAYSKHDNTADVVTKSVTASNTDTFPVAEGQVLSVWYKPKIVTMTGRWQLWAPAIQETGVSPGRAEYWASVHEVVTGPAMLPSGSVDGTATPKYVPC